MTQGKAEGKERRTSCKDGGGRVKYDESTKDRLLKCDATRSSDRPEKKKSRRKLGKKVKKRKKRKI